MKCKCGKMINRPAANKSGVCYSCGSRDKDKKKETKRRDSETINFASLEGKE